MTTDQHINTIIIGLYPDAWAAWGPRGPDYDFTHSELEKLSPKLLEKIAGSLTRLSSLTELANTLIAWVDEHNSEAL